MKINITKEMVLSYLGYKGQDIGNISQLINQTIKDVCQIAVPKYIVDYQEIMSSENNIVRLRNNLELKGKSISKRLLGCQKVAVVVATIGLGFDKMLLSLQQAKPFEAIILDATGSAYVEEVMDQLNMKIIEDNIGREVTKRFSAGFGDLPLQTNKEIIEIYNATRKLGIMINQSFLMSPVKSVTAVMGIKDKV